MATKAAEARRKERERIELIERLEAVEKSIASLKRQVSALKREQQPKGK